MQTAVNQYLQGDTELRVHGVSGTPAEDMLGIPQVHRFSGDHVAGFYRRGPLVDGVQPPPPDRGQQVGSAHDPVGPRDRTVEGYSWSGLTSGSRTRALWLLLLPFLLVNVAYFAQPPEPAGGTARAPFRVWSGRAATGPLLRIFAVTLTGSLLLAVSTVAMDLGGWQCAGQTTCAHRHAYLRFLSTGWWSSPGRRVVVTALVPVLVFALIWWLGSRSWRALEQWPMPVRPARRPTAPGAPVPTTAVEQPLERRDFWISAPPVGRLRSLHVAAAAGALAAVIAEAGGAGGSAATKHIGYLLVGADLLLVALAVLATASRAIAERAGMESRPGSRPRVGRDVSGFLDVLTGGVRWAGLALLLVSMVYTALPRHGRWHTGGGLPGLAQASDVLLAVQLVLLALLTLALVAQRRGGKAPNAQGSPPAAFAGLGTVALAGLGWLVATAFSAGLVTRAADVLGTPTYAPDRQQLALSSSPLRVSPTYPWAGVAVLATAAVGLVLAGLLVRQWKSRPSAVRDAVAAEYGPEKAADTARVDTITGQWVRGGLTDRAVGYLGILILAAFVAAVAVGAIRLVDPGLVTEKGWTSMASGGSWAVGLVTIGLLTAGVRAWQGASNRRLVGILWDLGAFWPRAAHPLAPPCYAERAVPDLVWHVATAPPGSRVVISGHSQGSVIAAAAVLQLTPEQRARIGLVTAGNPLRRLYARIFPAHLGGPALTHLGELLTEDGSGAPTRWRNLWRRTDPIGGVVAPAVEGADEELVDPPFSRLPAEPRYPPALAHSDYPKDRGYDVAIREVLGMISKAAPPPAPPADRPPRPATPPPSPPPTGPPSATGPADTRPATGGRATGSPTTGSPTTGSPTTGSPTTGGTAGGPAATGGGPGGGPRPGGVSEVSTPASRPR